MRESAYRLQTVSELIIGVGTYGLGLALVGALLVHTHLVGRVGGLALALFGGGVGRVIGRDSAHYDGVW